MGAIFRLNDNVLGADRIKAEKELLLKQLLEVNFVEKVFPSEANFLLIKVDDSDVRYAQLLQKGIVVRNRSTQPLCDNCLRITVGTSEENILLINALKALQ